MKKIKNPEESVVLEFDFSSELSAVDSAVMSISIHGSGVDPAIATFYDGAHQVSGSKVLQRIKNGVAGVAYKVKCVGTRSSDIIVRRDIIYVEAA